MRKILFLSFIMHTIFGLYAQVSIDTLVDLSQVTRSFHNLPSIFIDESHNNLHRSTTGFRPACMLFEKMGFRVSGLQQRIEKEDVLDTTHILIIVNPIHQMNRGRPYNPIYSAYTDREIEIISGWVHKGGRLILIADHMPFAGSVIKLANAFGIQYENGFTDALTQNWPPRIFTGNNLSPIPGSATTIDSVCTFTGSALVLPENSIDLLKFNNIDTLIYTDTAWQFNAPLKTISLEGYVQGGIVKYGKGKVAAFGEAAMFTAQKIMPQGIKAGFNSEYATQNILFIRELMKYMME